MPVVNLKHLRTGYELSGQGSRTVVLINGLGLDMRTWGPFAQELASQNRVLRFDARGAGNALDNDAAFSTQDMAHDVLALCAHLDIERPIVLGVSTVDIIFGWNTRPRWWQR